MKTKIEKIPMAVAAALLCIGCENALDPLASGHYTDENMGEHPSIIRGFVDEAYSLLSTHYCSNEYVYFDCATDNGVATSASQAMRRFVEGASYPSDGTFEPFWSRDYNGIYYVNRFLRDNIGISTQYLLERQQDSLVRCNYQGDAYALRAWFQYDLLQKFGARASDSTLLGFPIIKEDFVQSEADLASIKRASYDECVRQILSDCDSALRYLPYANRDWLAENRIVQGSVRWQRFDAVSVTALKAMVYLMWASDTFNPGKDKSRWENAAKYAYQAMRFKLTEDAAHGFNPIESFLWTDPNSPEIYWCSRYADNNNIMEVAQYPDRFRGQALYAPSQELVDAFPMANGYPISDPRSGYNADKPYDGRDPRFYSTIFYNNSQVRRNGDGESMFKFNCTVAGAEAPGLRNTSLTGYYLKKFVYTGWNASDYSIQTLPRCVFFIRWTDMCLTFAEAANRAFGNPLDSSLGLSAKDALTFVRSRTTQDGTPGIGASSDPYLDECAQSSSAFESLVRNERRIETCFEGKRFFDLMRWGTSLEVLNEPNHKVGIMQFKDGMYYEHSEVGSKALQSVFLPIPYGETVKMPGLLQNEGWENWQK